MLKFEKKMISFFNKYMVHIGIFLAALFALGIRYMGRKYVGHDFQYLWAEQPGNCQSFLYRKVVSLIVSYIGYGETTAFILKLPAFAGDLGIFVLTCVILGQKWLKKDLLRVFFVLTAIMLSPVLLLSSVSGMRLDSLSICCILLAYILYKQKRPLPAAIVFGLSTLFSPIYWFIAGGTCFYALYQYPKKKQGNIVALLYLTVYLMVGLIVETATGCGLLYDGILGTIGSFLRNIGPGLATLTLIASFKNPKLRIPALVMQVLFLILIGFYQTYYSGVWFVTYS